MRKSIKRLFPNHCRFLMIVDEKSNFITARAYPELLLIEPTVRSSILTLKHRDMEPVHVNLAEVSATV